MRDQPTQAVDLGVQYTQRWAGVKDQAVAAAGGGALDMLLEDGLAVIDAYSLGDTLILRLGRLEVGFQEKSGGLWCVGSFGDAR